MSHPYTEEQVDTYSRAVFGLKDPAYTRIAHRELSNLHDAGITVNFPEPRFTVDSSGGMCDVRDTYAKGLRQLVTTYWTGHPAANKAAEAEARLLNEMHEKGEL